MHLDFCLGALGDRTHVLLEKPMANALEEAERMLGADSFTRAL